MVCVWLECFPFLRFPDYIWLVGAFFCQTFGGGMGMHPAVPRLCSWAQLLTFKANENENRSCMKWYSGSRSIPRDCLSGHLLRKWSVKKAKTDKIQEWVSAAEDGVCEKTGRQAGCSALKDSPGPEWRKSLSTRYRPPQVSCAAVDSREHVSKGFASQPTAPPNHLITLPLQR